MGGDSTTASAGEGATVPGRVCWALCIGSPWWPAVVVTRREMADSVAEHLLPPRDAGYLCIRYLGNELAPYDFMRREKLRDFLAHFAALLPPANARADQLRAVQEAIWHILAHGPPPQRNLMLCNAAIRSTCLHHKLKLAPRPAPPAAAHRKASDDDEYRPNTSEDSDESEDERPVVRRKPQLPVDRPPPARRKLQDGDSGISPPPVDAAHPRRRKLATARKSVPGGHQWAAQAAADAAPTPTPVATAAGPRNLARLAAEKAYKVSAGAPRADDVTCRPTTKEDAPRRPTAKGDVPRRPAANDDQPRRPAPRVQPLPKRPRTATSSPPAPPAELDAVHRRLDEMEANMRAGFERLREENREAFSRREADSRAHYECMQALFYHEAKKTEDAIKQCRASLPRRQ